MLVTAQERPEGKRMQTPVGSSGEGGSRNREEGRESQEMGEACT